MKKLDDPMATVNDLWEVTLSTFPEISDELRQALLTLKETTIGIVAQHSMEQAAKHFVDALKEATQ